MLTMSEYPHTRATDDENRTTTEEPKQDRPRGRAKDRPQVLDLDTHRVDYDLPALEQFLVRVFHTIRPDENVLIWATQSGTPGWPITLDGLPRLLRGTLPRALYYGTSTAKPNDDGELRNKHDLFDRLHVVVLDDVGTKVDVGKLPKALRSPSYVVESSEGNYQYGYVLKEPVEDLACARSLVQLVYDSGFTDGGGAMPMKLVRLPGGVNGKQDSEKKMFRVRLVEELSSWAHWTPAELLEACGCEVSWEQVLEAGTAALKRPKARSTSAWSPLQPVSPNLDGGVDPVLEWLYDEGYVEQETGDWTTIRCPQAHLHTSGEDTAGYSALGRGDEANARRRGFHCFHEHCSEFHTQEFLQWVAANGGPEAAMWDDSTVLNREWVYDAPNDVALQIFGSRKFYEGVSAGVLKNILPGTLLVSTGDKPKKVAMANAWLADASKVVVNGTVLDPTSTSPLIERGAQTYVNRFTRPDWSKGERYPEDVKHFLFFMRYLIPDRTDREYVLDWIAAKYQNMGFRGPGVLMIAKAQGTGRGTLAKMLGILFGEQNVASVTFPELTSGKEFNDWQETPLVITHETLDVADLTTAWKAYERLKTIIDPAPAAIRVRVPYRKAVNTISYSSHLLFSNHENAIVTSHDDRRFFVCRNPSIPARPSYFTQVHDWLDEQDEHGHIWPRAVGAWLNGREVNLTELLKPPVHNEARQAVADATATPVEKLMNLIAEVWPSDYISGSLVVEAVGAYAGKFGIEPVAGKRRPFDHAFNARTEPLPGRSSLQARVRVRGKQIRIRALPGRVKLPLPNGEIAAELEAIDMAEIRQHIEDLADDL